jgi:hypothetical protein
VVGAHGGQFQNTKGPKPVAATLTPIMSAAMTNTLDILPGERSGGEDVDEEEPTQ